MTGWGFGAHPAPPSGLPAATLAMRGHGVKACIALRYFDHGLSPCWKPRPGSLIRATTASRNSGCSDDPARLFTPFYKKCLTRAVVLRII